MEWISVDDRLPEKNALALCCFHHWNKKKDRMAVLVYVNDDEYNWKVWDLGSYMDELSHDYTVTHWMPLPKPPASQPRGE